ncbi:MAG: Na/Pi symporter [Victivallales bacterium]|nr:Na/Pi symporter [Victivallales bacterium]MCF7889175.1 Na/Pi symporter [Victivallales bacterium]
MKKTGKNILLSVFFLLMLFAGGCKKEYSSDTVDKIVLIQGAGQCVLPGQTCEKKLKLELLGPKIEGLFGGEGHREPVSGVKVRFEPLGNAVLKFDPETAVSKPGGEVDVSIKAGSETGDKYFKVIPEKSEKSLTVRVVCGVSVEGGYQETGTGEFTDEPVKVKIVDKHGKPVQGADVYFTVASSPEKKTTAECRPSKVETDRDGIAASRVKLGDKTGVYQINAEVNDAEKGLSYRNIKIKELGIDIWGLIITVLGGLALFIFGINLMSGGLQIIAGQKMKRVLHFFTSNRFIAVIAGMIITGAIQSSSACTVMVVGFVNAGLLSLTQAIGVVFGANMGTTVTAQIISFNLKGLALPAVIIGAVMMMFTKKTALKGIGQTVFGFGVLFFGMGMMGSELKLLSKFPSFVEFFSHFDCSPVNGYMPIGAVLGAIAIGTVMTVMVQSSSATIGIAMSLAIGGLINFYTAVPLILGDNIGTTITAMLASLGANKRAKQAAVAHMLFNLFGAFYMVILFFLPWPGTDIPVFLYLINSITPGDVFALLPENIARHIAMAHTVFNVFNVVLFLPFIPFIAKVCNMIVKIKDEKTLAVQYLEPRLLKTPSIAVRQTAKVITIMLQNGWYMLSETVTNGDLNRKIKDKSLKFVEEKENEVDKMQSEVTDYLVKISREELSMAQSEIIPLLMHCTNDAERIADYAEELTVLSDRYKNMEERFTEDAKQELGFMWQLVTEQYKNIMEYFEKNDSKNISKALKRGRKITNFAVKYERRHYKRLKNKKCEFQAGMIFVELLGIYVRISNQFTNIAERIPEIQKHYLNLN